MIERKNIIDLLGDRTDVYHSAVLTCFSFDPIFFESVYLPVLRNLGINNIVVLMESSVYDQLLSDPSYLAHSVNTNFYSLVRQSNGHFGVFHTKLALLFGSKESAMVLGSGNLTFSGMSLNEEVWNVFHMKDEKSNHFSLVRKAWEYVKYLMQDGSTLTKRRLQWMQEHTKWLQEDYVDEPVVLKDGEVVQMLYNNEQSTILEQLYHAIGDAVIKDITVVSPFFDIDGRFLKELDLHFAPARFRCILDEKRMSAPYALFSTDTHIEFYKYVDETHPLHAKIIELHSESETWILSGSANAGNMAFGTQHHIWNDEACILLKRVGRFDYFEELGFSDKVTPASLEECRIIPKPNSEPTAPSTIRVAITSSELREDGLHVNFSKSNVCGTLAVLNLAMEEITKFEISSAPEIILNLNDKIKEEHDVQMIMFTADGVELSNRCLVIRETDVERGNPDPKRRKLSLVLNDPDLLNRLDNLLEFIEFDDTIYQKKVVSSGSVLKVTPGTDEDDAVVHREDFFNFKNISNKQINTHSGIRILETLKNLLYLPKEEIASEESYENGSQSGEIVTDSDSKEKTAASATNDDEVLTDEKKHELEFQKRLRDTFSFLNKLELFLKGKCSDKDVQQKGNPAMNNLPKLQATPGLNACTSLNAALLMVMVVMSKNDNQISTTDAKKLRTSVYNCASLFYALYGFSLPTDDSVYSAKIRYLFMQNAIYLLVALSYFRIGQHDFQYQLPQIILNCLIVWLDNTDVLESVLIGYQEELIKQANDNVINETIVRINEVINMALDNFKRDDNKIPKHAFTKYDYLNPIFIYRSGYGFLITDVRGSKNGWDLSYRHPRFNKLKVELHGVTQYLGFKEEDI